MSEQRVASARESLPEWASIEAIQRHYDRLSGYYQTLWGEHIHHGYWEGSASPAAAQVKLIERLAERARIRPGSRVLDVGCGLGGSSRWLARQLGCSVLGITISPVQARTAEALTRECGLGEQVRYAVRDARDLSPVEEQFDAVWVIECSEHLPDKARFLRECARLLRPGGCLALCAWLAAENPTPTQLELLEHICRGMLCPALGSQGEYARWIHSAGFEEIESEEIGARVRDTWAHCAELVESSWAQGLLRLADPWTREFVATFPVMREAFACGALGYGMFTARLPSRPAVERCGPG